MNIEIMLKRQGALETFIKVVKTVVDEFYDDITTEEEEYTCFALVTPARAYDIHSNTFTKPTIKGSEYFGIINIIIPMEESDSIQEGDYYNDSNDRRYKIVAKEFWQQYVLLEAQLE